MVSILYCNEYNSVLNHHIFCFFHQIKEVTSLPLVVIAMEAGLVFTEAPQHTVVQVGMVLQLLQDMGHLLQGHPLPANMDFLNHPKEGAQVDMVSCLL